MHEEQIRISDWNTPTRITVSTPGHRPAPHERPMVSYTLVQRRVAPGRELMDGNACYVGGSIVTLPSDDADRLQRSGVLVPVDGGP